jgi:tetratricopeptide (TPR) repeat protein
MSDTRAERRPGRGRLLSRVLLLAVAVSLVGALPTRVWGQSSADAYFEFMLARHLEAQGDTRGARAALERAAQADPRSAEVRAEIASFHLRRNERGEAEKAAKAALALNEQNIEANRVLGLIYATRAENERPGTDQATVYLRDAILHLERVTAGSPGVDASLQYTLGRLYIANGEPDKAVQALIRVLNQNPASVQGRLSLAEAYAAGDDLANAVAVLSEIVDVQPRVAAALAQYMERAGLYAEAAEAYTKALEVQPTSRELKLRRIAVLYSAKDYERAASFAADARRQHPEDLRFARLQARALFDAGNRGEAISLLEATAKAFPRDNATQFALVDLYNDGGRRIEAEQVLRQILAADPSNPNALNYLGYLLALRGEQLDEAVKLVRRALEADPDNGAYLDSLGWAYFRRGDLDEAEKYLTMAAERLPRNAEVLDHLGDLHARRGRWQEAVDSWSRALEADEGDLDREAVQQKIDDARRNLAQ